WLSPSRLLSFSSPPHHPALHSFPTRRSSDLIALDDLLCGCAARFDTRAAQAGIRLNVSTDAQGWLSADRHYLDRMLANLVDNARSEEHTSELQSRENLVCRLLLEKKKKQHIT